jgi:hypothetical protein
MYKSANGANTASVIIPGESSIAISCTENADPICGNLKQLFKQSESPAEQGREIPLFIVKIPEMGITTRTS